MAEIRTFDGIQLSSVTEDSLKSAFSETLTIDDAEFVLKKAISSSTAADDDNPKRIRIIFRLSRPALVDAWVEDGLNDGVIVSACYTVPNAIQGIGYGYIPSTNAWGTSRVYAVMPTSVLLISLRKQGNGVISDEDYESMMDDLHLSVYPLERLDETETNEVPYERADHPEWQECTSISANGNYSNHKGDIAWCAQALDSYYRIDESAKFISWHGISGTGKIGIRLYDKELNYIGYGGVSSAVSGYCMVRASDNANLTTDARFAKFFCSTWSRPTDRLDQSMFIVGCEPVLIRPNMNGGVRVMTKYRYDGLTKSLVPAIPVKAGHRYRAYVKAHDSLSELNKVVVGLGYNGNFPNGYASNKDIMGGLYFEMVASTSHPASRLFLTTNTDTSGAGAKVEAAIMDMTEPDSFGQFGVDGYAKADIAQKLATRDGSFNSMLTIVHVSDIHGDAVRHQNMVEFSKKLARADSTVVIANTGDTVAYDGYDGTYFINDDYYSKYGIRYLVTVGNHEAFNRNGVGTVTEEYMRTNLIDPLADDSGYTIGDGKTYYYVDETAHKIRFIVLNEFEGFQGASTYMSEAQLNWFASTLASTPADYGVVVCCHAPFLDVVKVDGSGSFYQDELLWRWDKMGYPQLAQIVDAFIDKAQYSGTINGFSITANFANVASGVEFIAWMNGHEHVDRIGYYAKDGETTLVNDQLVLNVTCTNAWLNLSSAELVYDVDAYPYFTELSDLPRKVWHESENAFNVYCIDRENKTVRVARIGMDKTSDFEDRTVMTIPYAQ